MDSAKKTFSRQINNNIVQNPTLPKINNTTKYDFTLTCMKNQFIEKLQIEDKKFNILTIWKPLNPWIKLIFGALHFD